MNIDWNWFFSSFSQSAAALLGIIGAFIISRLIGIDEKINSLSNELEDLKIKYNTIKDKLTVRKYDWVNEGLMNYDWELINKIKRGEFEGLSSEKILKKIYEDRRLYKSDKKVLKTFNNLYEKYKPRTVGTNNSYEALPNIQTQNELSNELSKEIELITENFIDAIESIRRFKSHLKKINGFVISLDTMRKIIWTIIIAFPITVIYPLHFLPQDIGAKPQLFIDLSIVKNLYSLKGILLTVFFIAIEGIFAYFLFFIKNIKMNLSQQREQNLDKYRNIKDYCAYYRE
jgi:hypothetical protein